MSEFRINRFEILPVIIKNLLIINGLVFLAQNTLSQQINFNHVFALHTWQSPLFKPWQFITHLFMHGSLGHLFSNMLALWMFGSVLENLWGPKRFLLFYLVCGLGAALCHMGVLYYETNAVIAQYMQNPAMYEQLYYSSLASATVGASGAVFGCLAAFGFLFPNHVIYLYFLLPLKAKWFVLLYGLFELYAGLANSAGDDVAHFAHLGGAVVGFLLAYYWKKNQFTRLY